MKRILKLPGHGLVYSYLEVARKLKVDIGTIYRWRKKGVRGIKLQGTVRVGGHNFIPKLVLNEFLIATTAAADPKRAERPSQSPSRPAMSKPRDAAVEAGELLDKLVFRRKAP